MRKTLFTLLAAVCLAGIAAPLAAQDGCTPCSGWLVELTLRYNGDLADAMIRVTQKERSQVHVLFEGVVAPGEEFTVVGANEAGTLKPNIHIFVNGRLSTPLPANCEAVHALGYSKGDFEIVGGVGEDGTELCPDDGGGDDGDGDECCDGQVSELTLRYDGEQADAQVEVVQRDGNDRIVIFDGVVQPGEEFSFAGQNANGTMGPSIDVFVNGALNTSIHTSCSEPIGPGLVSGDFEVVAGASRDGGELCPVEPDEEPPEDGECGECDGQVTELTLSYIGTEYDARIQAFQKISGERVNLYEEILQPGDEFTIYGANPKGTFGSRVVLQVNTVVNTRIHTSCSEPIGPDSVWGDFEVVAGASRNGGELCPVEPPEDPACNCDGQVSQLTLRYIGTEPDVRVQVFQKVRGARVELVDEIMQPGETISFQGMNNRGTLGSRVAVQVNTMLNTQFHTSCSAPIGPGLVSGDFEVVEGFSLNGGRLCAVE